MMKAMRTGARNSSMSLPTRKRIFARAGAAMALGLAACLPVCGQNLIKRWATTYETHLGAGFDSNINGERQNETDDVFVSGLQSIKVSRVNSLTQLDFLGNISGTEFTSEGDASFVDGGVEVNAAYPDESVDVTFWRASAYWNRSTQVNLDAGERIQPTVYGARLAGDWLYSAKSGFTGAINAITTDRSRDGYSTTRSLSLRTGFSHAWRPEKRWSFEYGLNLSETDAGQGTDSTEHLLGIRGRGTLLPKVSGHAFLGVSRSDFEGVSDFSDTGPVASVDLTWTASPQFTAQIGLDSEYDFTARGEAAIHSTARVRLRRELGNGFRVAAGIRRGYIDYEGATAASDRSDRFWDLRGELEYAFTKRFFVILSADLLSSETTLAEQDLDRSIVQLVSGWRY